MKLDKTKMVRKTDGVLKEGEVTGHMHAIETGANADIFVGEDSMLLSSRSDTPVTHPEHGTVTIPTGDYRIGTVSEYDYGQEAQRDVID